MLIAVPMTNEDIDAKLSQASEKGADIVELRVDQFSNRDIPFIEECVRKAKERSLKVLLTIRSPEEGGRHIPHREEIFNKIAPLCDYADIELSSRDLIIKVREAVESGGGRLIISYHNFERTPPNWIIREVLREGYRYGGIPKISVQANSYEDVSRLLCVGAQEKYDKVLIAMGDFGKASRVAGFVFGSLISYASLGESLAPGQLPLEEMVKLRELLCK